MKLFIVIAVAATLTLGAVGGETLSTDMVQVELEELIPTPVPTPSPAEVFGSEKGIMAPSVAGEIITDTEEIKSIVAQNPYWSHAEGDRNIVWFKDSGRYTDLVYDKLVSSKYDMYGGGEWYFEGEMLCIEDMGRYVFADIDVIMSGEVTPEQSQEFHQIATKKYVPMASKADGTTHLYLCTEDECIEYIPATEEEKLLVSTDPNGIANKRYFICSATWLLAGHYDENSNYSHRSNTRAYTFLADGQLVVHENGKAVAGYYTLNFRDNGFFTLVYVLEDGRAMYTPLWTDNSSSYASALFLYPELDSNASDVYMAKSKYNVSKYITEGEAIPRYPG